MLSGLWCQNIERIIVDQGQPFTFDCQYDESVFFSRRLNEWLEIQKDNQYYSYLKLDFNYIIKENILRVTSNAAEAKNVGYYTCGKPEDRTTSKNTIYQIVIRGIKTKHFFSIMYILKFVSF